MIYVLDFVHVSGGWVGVVTPLHGGLGIVLDGETSTVRSSRPDQSTDPLSGSFQLQKTWVPSVHS